MNRVILMGRLTKEPDMRYSSQTNNAVCRFSIAVDRRFVRPGEERETDFFNIVAFGKTGEFCGKYFQKGMRVLVTGRLQNNNWDDQQGVKHYSMDIIADEAHFADGKGSGGSQEAGTFSGDMPWNTGGGSAFQNTKPQAVRREAPPAFGGNASFGNSPARNDQRPGSGDATPSNPPAASAQSPQSSSGSGEEDGYFPMDDDDQLPF